MQKRNNYRVYGSSGIACILSWQSMKLYCLLQSLLYRLPHKLLHDHLYSVHYSLILLSSLSTPQSSVIYRVYCSCAVTTCIFTFVCFRFVANKVNFCFAALTIFPKKGWQWGLTKGSKQWHEEGRRGTGNRGQWGLDDNMNLLF